jgi:hypothetical protein
MANEKRLSRESIGLIVEADSAEGTRVKGDLEAWATTRGYKMPLKSLPNGQRPDVLCFEETKRFLFIGDAKDAANETAGRTDTCQRLVGYFGEFGKCLLAGTIDGGTIAIATNKESAANEWVLALNFIAILEGLKDGAGEGPDFKIDKPRANTWVIYW